MQRSLHRTLAWSMATLVLVAPSLSAQKLVQAPKVILGGVPFSLTLEGAEDTAADYEIRDADGVVLASGSLGAQATVTVEDIVVAGRSGLPLTLRLGSTTETLDRPFAYGWYSLMPPLIAILMALIFREVVTALLAGIWLGALAVAGYNPLQALWRVVDTYAVPALADSNGHTQIVVFSLLLGGMVGIIARNGGTQGIVDAVAPFASTSRRGKIATWLAGLAIFFDDYANTLIVGNTMRPITDRLKISREKLAYIVDSTAAPVAALVPISTWVGYEISLIGDGLDIAAAQQSANPALAEALSTANPFGVFINTIPYLFYPLLAVAFVFLTSVMDRDLGPMAAAEKRAASGGGLHRPGATLATDTSSAIMQAKDGVSPRWYNAALPVLTVILVVLGGLYTDGRASAGPGASLMEIFGAADPFATLLWGSFAGCVVGIALSVGQRILSLQEALDAWAGGMKAMVTAMVILVMAWSLGQVTEDVGTAQFLAQAVSDALPLGLVPALVFVISAAIAFATGTSWATMAILIPLVIPLAVTLGGAEHFAVGGGYSILLGSISSVLAGAIFGDHCSPISDTTVLSSTAAACDHVDHVRTQLPYALLVAVVAMTIGDLGTAFGIPHWFALLGGVGVLFAILRVWGTPTGDQPSEASAT
ncbi:MAG: Na+/H+ antiporter NhaC family protein [Gemmatimonadota bacterium]|nr:MAG: Na+/H+ antiporter NhaC family protein [Gemmatimonadota bacterium]